MRLRRTCTALATAALATSALAVAASTTGAGAAVSSYGGPGARGAGAPPGPAGPALVLQDQTYLHGYDVAVAADGTTYIGWVGATGGPSTRVVYLCALPPGALSCAGGVRTAPTPLSDSASGLRLLAVGDTVTLVWFHDTAQSPDGPFNARIATSTVQKNYSLSAPVDAASAPSFGSMLDAETDPGGTVWAVTQRTVGAYDPVTELQVQALGQPSQTIAAPWLVGKTRLSFDWDTGGVLVMEKYGSIGVPLRVSHPDGGGWTAPVKVPHTWSAGGAFDLGGARGKVRLVASVDNAHYYPQEAAWNGSAFGRFTPTGDRGSCPKASHDLFVDSSQRLSDTYFECDELTVVNMPTAVRAALVRFPVSSTPSGGDPQIGTTPRGTGWVVWGQLSSTPGTGSTLMAAPVRLPPLSRTVRVSAGPGVVKVTGPVSCLPAVNATVAVRTEPSTGWSLVSKQLLLDGDPYEGILDGVGLAAGSSHTLTGTATFRRGADRRTLTKSLTFTACPEPSAF